MRRTLAYGWVGALLLIGGCATGPLQENPLVVRPAAKADASDNPVYIPFNSAPASYAALFEKVLDVMSDSGFEIAYSNRYDGRVETFPKIAPGLAEPWRPGSPDFPQRLVATFQTIRHRAIVLISPANDFGYFVDVKVFKELEDLPRPSQATAGSASFRSEPSLELPVRGRRNRSSRARLDPRRSRLPDGTGHPGTPGPLRPHLRPTGTGPHKMIRANVPLILLARFPFSGIVDR